MSVKHAEVVEIYIPIAEEFGWVRTRGNWGRLSTFTVHRAVLEGMARDLIEKPGLRPVIDTGTVMKSREYGANWPPVQPPSTWLVFETLAGKSRWTMRSGHFEGVRQIGKEAGGGDWLDQALNSYRKPLFVSLRGASAAALRLCDAIDRYCEANARWHWAMASQAEETWVEGSDLYAAATSTYQGMRTAQEEWDEAQASALLVPSWFLSAYGDFREIYRASLAAGAPAELAGSAKLEFLDLCRSQILADPSSTAFDVENPEVRRRLRAWDAARDRWAAAQSPAYRPWIPLREREEAAEDQGRELGVAWFGLWLPDEELDEEKPWEKIDVLPDDVSEILDEEFFDEVAVGCVILDEGSGELDLQIEVREPSYDPVADEDDIEVIFDIPALEKHKLGERRRFEKHGRHWVLASCRLDLRDKSFGSYPLRLLFNGEWVATDSLDR